MSTSMKRGTEEGYLVSEIVIADCEQRASQIIHYRDQNDQQMSYQPLDGKVNFCF